METILDKILENKRREIKERKKDVTYRMLENSAFFDRSVISLSKNISKESFGIIGEVKRKSPSAGDIKKELDLNDLIKEYEQMQFSGVSILTDEHFFGGSIADIENARLLTSLPILRKEFIIDEFQIFEAKAIGADAILLIAEALTERELLHFTIIAKGLGLEVLAEFHEKSQFSKINDEVDIIGVNNRNLKLQQTNIQVSLDMIDLLPSDKVIISESGIKTIEDIELLKSVGYKGALIGESILKNQLNFQ